MLLDENVQSIKLCLSTIIRDLRWNKQKTTKLSPFEAHFGRFPKTEFKILRDKFINESGRLDKEHLEGSALTASQLKRRIDQSRENVKIFRKGKIVVTSAHCFYEIRPRKRTSKSLGVETITGGKCEMECHPERHIGYC